MYRFIIRLIRLLYYLPMERMKVKYVIDGKDYVTLPAYEILEDKYNQLEEENKKLNIKVASLEWEIKWLNYTIEKLKEENQTLELWLDRKEKLNEKYRKEIKGLKSDLWECECSFWFENDEVWYRKREYKRLKKWIKDHCKWYWNLFPEDEMKRQWKKADKKRK